MNDRPAPPDQAEDANRDREPARRIRTGMGMRVRIDSGSGSGQDLAPGRASLLGAFHFNAWGRKGTRPSPALERRAEPRHRHVECLAWVGWRTWRGFRMNDAVLINLSRGGARIFLDERPPSGRPIWVFLETPGRKAVVKAEIHEVETTASGQCSARVGFLDACPYHLFEAAVCGLAASDPKVRLAAPPRLAGRIAANRKRRAAVRDDDGSRSGSA